MHCHDVLGIQEAATEEEIAFAYHNKITQLYAAVGKMPADAYSYKLKELKSAYEECIEWRKKPKTEKIEERMEETSSHKSSQVKLYSSGICIGPCTCLDACCYCGNTGTSTFCISTVGSQAVPIICDSLIWLSAVIAIASGLLPGISDRAKQRKSERESIKEAARQSKIENILEENRVLQQQLVACESRIASLQEQVETIERAGTDNAAFSNMFTEIGVTDNQVLSDNQKEQIQVLQSQIKSCKEQAVEIRDAIAVNQRRIESI